MKNDAPKYDVSRFKRALRIKGWSQKKLAGKVGLSQAAVCDFLNGKTEGPETAAAIAAQLGLRMEDVVLEGAAQES